MEGENEKGEKGKGEREREQFSQQMRQSNKIYRIITIFQLDYAMIDLTLLVSQLLELDIENHIFQVLLTIFNLQLAFVIHHQDKCCDSYATYFLSGIFVFTNICLKWIAGLHYHVITFSLNWIIQLSMIRQFAFKNILYVIPGYTVYLLIFANIDGILSFDIRWVMVCPALISLALFFKFGKEIYDGLTLRDAFKMPRHLLSFAIIKIGDFGVFLATSLPLYSTFISKQLSTLAGVASAWHLSNYIFYVLYQERFIFYQFSTKTALYRLNQNHFTFKLGYIPFSKGQGIWDSEICSKCCKSSATVLFKRCGHFVLCKQCLIDLQKKGWNRCLICNKEYYVCLQISLSFAEMSEAVTFQSEAHNLYLISDQVRITIEQESESD